MEGCPEPLNVRMDYGRQRKPNGVGVARRPSELWHTRDGDPTSHAMAPAHAILHPRLGCPEPVNQEDGLGAAAKAEWRRYRAKSIRTQ